MKKVLDILTVILVAASLTACGRTSNNSQQAKTNSSLKAENSSLKAESSNRASQKQTKYNDSEYAFAAYLKLQNQSASDIQANDSNMTWQRQGNRYTIGFGGHTTSMTVNESDVDVTYDDVEGDHMGNGNGHRTYSKSELSKLIKEQKKTIDDILSGQRQDQGSQQNQASQQGTQTSKANATSTSSNSSQASDNARYDLPLSVPRNRDGVKQAQMMIIAGDPQYRNTPDGSVNEQGRAMMSSIRGTMHN